MSDTMRVMLLTPGTGHFYCGSCLRDDTLGRALRRIGHEVTVAPLYLPMLLERDQPEESVHMGGINVYLQQKTRLARLIPRFVTKWLDNPRILRWAARRGNMTNAASLGSMTVSILRGEDGRQALEIEKLIEWIATQPRPDVVIISNAMLIGIVRKLRAKLDAAIIVTLQGETPFLDSLPDEHAQEAWTVLRERVPDVHGLIAVSEAHGNDMRNRLAIESNKLHIVHNGIEAGAFEGGAQPVASRRPKTIGYLARMCRDKGLDTLVAAFLILKQRGTIQGLRLRIAGVQLPEDRSYVRELRHDIEEHAVTADVDFLPNIQRGAKIDFLHTLSVLSVPARYQESFGLYLLEAMAAGVPVVQPQHASFPEILAATGGGLLYEPNTPTALADSLETLLLDDDRATKLGEQGLSSVATKFTADHMARRITTICKDIVADRGKTTS